MTEHVRGREEERKPGICDGSLQTEVIFEEQGVYGSEDVPDCFHRQNAQSCSCLEYSTDKTQKLTNTRICTGEAARVSAAKDSRRVWNDVVVGCAAADARPVESHLHTESKANLC